MNKHLKCTWCFKDTKTTPCEHCGKTTVWDPYQEHTPLWSAYSLVECECAVCGRTTTYDKQTIHPCPPKHILVSKSSEVNLISTKKFQLTKKLSITILFCSKEKYKLPHIFNINSFSSVVYACSLGKLGFLIKIS
jgi:hypothetical protein